jgi:hypothetical protein
MERKSLNFMSWQLPHFYKELKCELQKTKRQRISSMKITFWEVSRDVPNWATFKIMIYREGRQYLLGKLKNNYKQKWFLSQTKRIQKHREAIKTNWMWNRCRLLKHTTHNNLLKRRVYLFLTNISSFSNTMHGLLWDGQLPDPPLFLSH